MTTALNEETADAMLIRPSTANVGAFHGEDQHDPWAIPHALMNEFTPNEVQEMRATFR